MSEHFEKAWQTILSSPSMYRKGFKAGVEAVHGLHPGSFSKVVILGVGGSGIVGDVVASLKEPGCEAEVLPIKDIKAPDRCGPETLVIAVSYSGNTAETLHAVVDSLNKRAKVVGVSTGGRLTSFLESRGFSVVRVSEGYEPRYAVPEMVGAVYGLLSSVSGYEPKAFEKAVEELGSFLNGFSILERNPAFEAADLVLNRTAVVVSFGHLAPAAQRLKAQLNENAKHPAYSVLIPDACHNEVEGWVENNRFVYILQRSSFEPAIYSDAFDWMESFLDERGIRFHEIRLESKTHQSEVLKHVAYADLLSVALAKLKNVNPFELSVIPQLRPLLRKHLL